MIKGLKKLFSFINKAPFQRKTILPEELVTRIFFEAPIPIFLCDEKGKVLEQNRKAYHVFGYAKDNYLSNLLYGVRISYRHGFAEGSSKKNQGYFEYFIEGEKPAIVYILDKTDLQSLKEEYRFAMSYLSHELKTPVAVVQAKTETLLAEVKEGINHDKLLENLSELTQKIANLSNLVKRLFQMSSILVKELKVVKRNIKLSELFSDLRTLTEDQAEEKKIKLIFDYTEDFTLYVDPELFLQALFNLVENAIKFSQEGTKVWVSAKKIQNKINFIVEDEGLGVSEEEIPFLTRPFYRARVLGKGLGLGLFLVDTIVKAHDGELKLMNVQPPKTGFIAEIILEDQPK